MKPTVLIFATIFEAQSFLTESKAIRITDVHHENNKVSILISGVGKVNAAVKVAHAIQAGAKLIVNAGIAGCVSHNYSLFDVLMPNEFVDLDRIKGPFSNETKKIVSKDCLSIGTTDTPVHGGSSKSFAEKYCQLVDMESYAIVSLAQEFAIEVKIIKCISDFCEIGGEKSIKTNLNKASMILSQTLFSQGYA